MNKTKKRILLVLDTFYPNVDGPVNSIINIAEIANSNPEYNCEIELLVPYYPEVYKSELVIHRCKSMKFGDTYRTPVPIFDRNVKKIIKNGVKNGTISMEKIDISYEKIINLKKYLKK